MSATEVYTGGPLTSMIADRTNPWVEVDGKPFAWLEGHRYVRPAAPGNDCDGCCDSPVPGTIPAMDTEHGIQRCDACQRFNGDLDAALALSRLVGGRVLFAVETDD